LSRFFGFGDIISKLIEFAEETPGKVPLLPEFNGINFVGFSLLIRVSLIKLANLAQCGGCRILK
jgi:hypothetical protein